MNKFIIEIPSYTKFIEPIVSALNTIGDELLLNEDKKWALEISLREALANAIIHGNNKDLNKYVRITFNWDNKEFIIIVEDEGKGFTPSSIKEEPNLKTSGRGVMIIENKIDDVKYERGEKGFRVILKKKIS